MIELNEMTESNMTIGPNAIIWPDGIIINWTICGIGPNVTFESNTIIGPDVTIGPNVVIGKNHTIIGYNTRAAIDSSMA